MSAPAEGVPGADLPAWCALVRADNPGPLTLEGTNTYALSAAGSLVVVDPGPLLDDHLQRVAGLGPVALVLLTHGHPDHAEGARRFAAMTGAPVRARQPTLCIDGEPLTVDGAPCGVDGREIHVLHTPGHTADSVCFMVADERGSALITGDTVLGRGTTVLAHPDGGLGDYLRSLERLRSLGSLLLLPGHGPVRPDAAATAAAYLAHRHERLAQVQAALGAGARTAAEVVERVYADVDRALWPAAELSVRAQLAYLAGRSAGHHPPPGRGRDVSAG